jgi:hypothetical protein
MTTPTPREMEVVASAIDAADQRPEEDKREEKAVRWWLEQIEQAREFDKDAYKKMGYCRAVATGVTPHEVSVNVIGSNIDTLKAVLYARNPDVAVKPSPQTSAPTLQRPVPPTPPENPLPQLQAMLEQGGNAVPGGTGQLMADPAVQQQIMVQKAQYEQKLALFEQQKAAYEQELMLYIGTMMQRRAEREERKRFSETLEILISKAWELADLKEQARYAVGTTLTTCIGWLKATWQEDAGLDPIALNTLQSLQENMRAIEDLRVRVTRPEESGNRERLLQDLGERLTAISAAREAIVARGLIIDWVAPEDMTCPIGVTRIAQATSCAPWLAQRVFMTKEKAKVTFPDVEKLYAERGGDPRTSPWAKATTYSQRKPKFAVSGGLNDAPATIELRSDPSQFTAGKEGQGAEMAADGTGDFVCIHEIWDKEAGMIRTVAEGMDCYLRPSHAPEIRVTRFYPYYSMAFVETDGTRYPDSLTARSAKLQDERNARLSAAKKVRQRSKQGILGDATAVDKDEAGKIQQSVEGEITYVRTTGDKPIQNVFMAKPIVQMDPALYRTDDIDANLERIWGIQEARQGTVSTEKTATEADIQEQGFNSRTTFMREPLEVVLGDLAVATAEILLQRLTIDDAREYAGPHAVWPQAASVQDLASLVSVSIKAGSTGKPNNAAERAAWNAAMPIVLQSVKEIGALRGAPPTDVADSLEAVLNQTFRLLGSSMTAAEFVPQESMPTPQADAAAMNPEMSSAPASTGPMAPLPSPGPAMPPDQSAAPAAPME